MKQPQTIQALEELGRVRLSKHFFMRDFLYSDITNIDGVPNIPDDPDLAIAAGTRLCEELLEPLEATFGRIAIRSAYRSSAVNGFGSDKQKAGNGAYKCGSNEYNHAAHIWDRRDAQGRMGATACIVVPWFADRYAAGRRLARAGVVDTRPPELLVDVLLSENGGVQPAMARTARTAHRLIRQPARALLTKPGMDNHEGSHASGTRAFRR
jgi:hypothetical protein